MCTRARNDSGRGLSEYYVNIGIDPAWTKYETFRDWALSNGYTEDLELDRINPRSGYGPDNCRWATREQQMQNVRWHRCKHKTSIFKGVQYVAHCRRKWRANGWDGKPVHLGLFETQLAAALAYDAWARVAYGEFARVNFAGRGGS